ncbi:MAG: ATP-binding cassette domain-containing protein [candidate division WOR-3 bacterium]
MVEVKNLTKSFGKEGIYDINLSIEKGTICAIIGKSGSGKSLLLKNILGLIKPDKGEVYIDGVNVHKAKYSDLKHVREKMGVLFQNNALFDSMNVFENVSLPVVYNNPDYDLDTLNQEVLNILTLLSLPDVRNKEIKDLSGGMQKRVAIARSLITNPSILFYDEPITGLDPLTGNKIIELIKEIHIKLKKTTVVITHDLRGFIDFIDHILLLDNGKEIFWGTKEDFFLFDNEIAKSYLKMAGQNGR